MTVVIEKAHAPTDEVRALIAALEAELAPNYAPNQRHGLALEAIFRPHIHFFVARRAGQALGCAGVALFRDFAEVKRMYVCPQARGQGIADALMDRLAQVARQAGLAVLKLETGDRQLAAIRFYARLGFRDCADFEPYSSMPVENIATSVFMEKVLV
jgi:putative acetyltransferase